MSSAQARAGVLTQASSAARPVFLVLVVIAFCHLLNDMMQSLFAALYPMLKSSYALSFGEVGLLTFTFQLTASLLQPIIGAYTDRSPRTYSLPMGMMFSLGGLVLLAYSRYYGLLLLAAVLFGTGASVFHPEGSRMARAACAGRPGLAQSVFQAGGNIGSAVGPLLAACFVVPRGQSSVAWFSCTALLAILLLFSVARWYKAQGLERPNPRGAAASTPLSTPNPKHVAAAITILLTLIFAKYFYLVSLTSYFTFYLIHTFNVSVQSAQIRLFIFLGAVALGTIVGGPLGDRFGPKYIIWASILGVLPFTVLLPHANLFWTSVLTVPIGTVLASAFPAIVVYAQEMLPGRTGTVAGLFFGFAFGMGGIGAALLGRLADAVGINLVYQLCAFLPLIGVIAVFMPRIETRSDARI